MFAIIPYLRNSHSVVALLEKFEEAGEYARVRLKTAPKSPRTILIQWGVRDPAYDKRRYRLLNGGDIKLLSDKLRFFKHVGHDSGMVPQWTTSDNEAKGWNDTVVARFKTAASGGEGIVIHEQGSEEKFPGGAPLYTRYQKKTHEYRCHVFKNPVTKEFEVRLVQRKAARKNEAGEAEVKDWKVRNLENGFVFVKNDGMVAPDCVTNLATAFMRKYFSDMDFCALDIIYHKPSKKALVLEGNTAPGLEGTTVDVYVNYFKEVKANG